LFVLISLSIGQPAAADVGESWCLDGIESGVARPDASPRQWFMRTA
jgi:hypothetical protein